MFATAVTHLFIFRVKRVISRAIHRAYDIGTIALKYKYSLEETIKKNGGQGVSGQPVADVIIATKSLVPFYLFSGASFSPIASPVRLLSSTSSHPFINTSILGTVEMKVSGVVGTN